MGFFKNVRELEKIGKEVQKNMDVKGTMSNGMERMRQAQTMMAHQTAAARLSINGLDATATISSATQTGQFINMQPVLRLDLLIFTPGGAPPYPVTVDQAVAPAYLGSATAGSEVRVKVDAGDHQTVWINWMA